MNMPNYVIDRNPEDVKQDTWKGQWNVSDANRIIAEVNYLIEIMRDAAYNLDSYREEKDLAPNPLLSMPYSPEYLTPIKAGYDKYSYPNHFGYPELETTWTLRDFLPVPEDYPIPPYTMDVLTWEDANNWELSLKMHTEYAGIKEQEIKTRIDATAASSPITGSAICGQ